MRKVLVAVFLLVTAGIASADTLTLNPVLINHQFQQTTNNPCVIGDTSCHQPAGMDETVFPTSVSSYDSLSPVYTVGQLRDIVGNTFWVGVDINQTEVVQRLSYFSMSINGVVVDEYIANPYILVPPTVGGGNGNGYADYLLKNFTSLANYAATDTVQFHVIMPLINDGREEYFLISASGPTQTPEPASLALLGSGLLAGGGVLRRKFRLS